MHPANHSINFTGVRKLRLIQIIVVLKVSNATVTGDQARSQMKLDSYEQCIRCKNLQPTGLQRILIKSISGRNLFELRTKSMASTCQFSRK